MIDATAYREDIQRVFQIVNQKGKIRRLNVTKHFHNGQIAFYILSLPTSDHSITQSKGIYP